jgi:nicotinamide phosphoribosyltransferase
VLGIGSYTYQLNTRDTFGFAAKGAWFEANGIGYDIFKDPVTDDGTKKSLKGKVQVVMEGDEYHVNTQCDWEQESQGLLQIIYEDGKFPNQTTLTEIRNRINTLANE